MSDAAACQSAEELGRQVPLCLDVYTGLHQLQHRPGVMVETFFTLLRCLLWMTVEGRDASWRAVTNQTQQSQPPTQVDGAPSSSSVTQLRCLSETFECVQEVDLQQVHPTRVCCRHAHLTASGPRGWVRGMDAEIVLLQ